jgi:hypothetical protein
LWASAHADRITGKVTFRGREKFGQIAVVAGLAPAVNNVHAVTAATSPAPCHWIHNGKQILSLCIVAAVDATQHASIGDEVG